MLERNPKNSRRLPRNTFVTMTTGGCVCPLPRSPLVVSAGCMWGPLSELAEVSGCTSKGTGMEGMLPEGKTLQGLVSNREGNLGSRRFCMRRSSTLKRAPFVFTAVNFTNLIPFSSHWDLLSLSAPTALECHSGHSIK